MPATITRHWEASMQHWIELGMGMIAALALAASAFEGLRLWRDWRRSNV